MGISNLTDALTGLSIEGGEETVSFVIAPVRRGYPDADLAKAYTGSFFNSQFKLASFPIRGKASDYKNIDVYPDQLSVDWALEMIDVNSWNDFSKAFDFSMGARIKSFPRFQGDAKPIIYGLCVLKKESWEYLTNFINQFYPKESNVNEHMLYISNAIQALESLDGKKHDELSLQESRYKNNVLSILDFSTSILLDLQGNMSNAPEFASLLGNRTVFDPEFSNWMQDSDRAVGVNCIERFKDKEWLENILGDFWTVYAFKLGMECHNRVLAPSPSAGQSTNDFHHCKLAVSTIEQASNRLALNAEESDVELEELRALEVQLTNLLKEVELKRQRVETVIQELNSNPY